ncbi:MAG: folate-binding protein [Hyphomicrobium sp.]
MSAAKISRLPDRGVVSVTGADAAKLLQGLVTNDIAALETKPDDLAFAASAAHAGLLSPQGKILFEFFCVRTLDGFVLDVARDQAPALAKRLTMYKLRADVTITDVPENYAALALWGPSAISSGPTKGTIAFDDPRDSRLGKRILAEARFATDIASATNGQLVSDDAYHAHRIALGVPEGGKDYALGDAYPHEANFDLFHGVSFTKGCYVGQEVVARMQNKTVVRKRIVKIAGAAPLTPGTDILLGEIAIGRTGSGDGNTGLAMLRLDRAIEAIDQGMPLTSGGIVITPDTEALARYRVSAAHRPFQPGL